MDDAQSATDRYTGGFPWLGLMRLVSVDMAEFVRCTNGSGIKFHLNLDLVRTMTPQTNSKTTLVTFADDTTIEVREPPEQILGSEDEEN